MAIAPICEWTRILASVEAVRHTINLSNYYIVAWMTGQIRCWTRGGHGAQEQGTELLFFHDPPATAQSYSLASESSACFDHLGVFNLVFAIFITLITCRPRREDLTNGVHPNLGVLTTTTRYGQIRNRNDVAFFVIVDALQVIMSVQP